MARRPQNNFVRIGLCIAAIALLSAFSYPLVRESCRRVGDDTFQKAQTQILEQSIARYVALNPEINWNADTATRQILNDLSVGLDSDLSGKPQTFLPVSESVDTLAHNYRILYKGPNNFKVIAK